MRRMPKSDGKKEGRSDEDGKAGGRDVDVIIDALIVVVKIRMTTKLPAMTMPLPFLLLLMMMMMADVRTSRVHELTGETKSERLVVRCKRQKHGT